MRGSHLIYQDLADPILPLQAVETITLDKWYQQPVNPRVKRAFVAAVFSTSFFFVQAQITIDRWGQPTQQPRVKGEIVPSTSFFFVPAQITVDRWGQPTQQPQNKRQWAHTAGEIRVDVVAPSEVVTIDKWSQPIGQPRKREFIPNSYGLTFVDLVTSPPPPVVDMGSGSSRNERWELERKKARLLKEEKEILDIINLWLKWEK